MLKRVIGMLAVAGPGIAGGLIAPGCSGEKAPQDLCRWLGDANNCYARFANDIGTQCGYPADLGASDPLASTTGEFADRQDLSTCVKGEAFGSGFITFDPPLDPILFPLESVGFKVFDRRGELCGSGSADGFHAYTITIEQVLASDPGASGPLDDDITGGTFAATVPEGRNQLSVSCPSGLEDFTFNTLVLRGCEDLAAFVPAAFLDSSPGVPPVEDGQQGTPGFVRLRILYPPVDSNEAGAQPRIVEYFNCLIPPPPHICHDGIRNGSESDVDCGGSCVTKCATGQLCNTGDDCQSGTCTTVGGIRQCA